MVRTSDFKDVEIHHRDLFRDHYRKYPIDHSDYLHGIMCTWKHYMKYSFARIDESIVILGEHDGQYFLRPPIGPDDENVLNEVIDLSVEQGWEPLLAMVGERSRNLIERTYPKGDLEYDRDYFDYVYLSEELRDLPGKPYLKIRNYLNKFRKNNDHSVETITNGNKKEIKDFLVRWCEQKGCSEDPFLLQERQATMFGIENIFDLGLEGLCIRVNGQVEALSIFEEMSDDIAVIHFEKATFDIPGLYQAINNEAAAFLSERFRFIDRESDMGVPGLRKAKEKYRPHHMLKVSELRTV